MAPPNKSDDISDRKNELIEALSSIDGVVPHDSRFNDEIAFKATSDSIGKVQEVVVDRLGPKVEAATDGDPMVKALGGIRGDQSLYRCEVASGVSLYVALWPWGGGSAVTIKVGIFG